MTIERRLHERKETDLLISLNISALDFELSGDARTDNISIGGIKLYAEESLELSENIADAIVGRDITVNFSDYKLSVDGSVLRADHSSREMAVIINEVSNLDLWKDMCSILKSA